MAFSCNMLLVNQSARLVPGGRLATLNGLAQMSSSVMRAVGPYAGSSLFALSVERNWLGGRLIWPVLFAVSVVGILVTGTIQDLDKQQEQQQAAEANPEQSAIR